VAELLKSELGVKVDVVPGDRGEFTVRVGDKTVAKKNWLGFPSDQKVLAAVRAEIAADSGTR
jgi:predicted Rdx family selenoprotein